MRKNFAARSHPAFPYEAADARVPEVGDVGDPLQGGRAPGQRAEDVDEQYHAHFVRVVLDPVREYVVEQNTFAFLPAVTVSARSRVIGQVAAAAVVAVDFDVTAPLFAPTAVTTRWPDRTRNTQREVVTDYPLRGVAVRRNVRSGFDD